MENDAFKRCDACLNALGLAYSLASLSRQTDPRGWPVRSWM